MPMVMPIREFGNAEKVRSVCMNASDPIFISRDGKEEMVLLNIALYNHLFARAEIYRKLENRRMRNRMYGGVRGRKMK